MSSKAVTNKTWGEIRKEAPKNIQGKKKRQSELIKWKETDNGNDLTLMWQP